MHALFSVIDLICEKETEIITVFIDWGVLDTIYNVESRFHGNKTIVTFSNELMTKYFDQEFHNQDREIFSREKGDVKDMEF